MLVYMLPQVVYLSLIKNLDSDISKVKTLLKELKVSYKEIKRNKDEVAISTLELEEDKLLDLYYMLKETESKIKSLLSKKIKSNLNKTKLTLESRVYTGYDTEFETKEYSVNEIVSAQAVSVTTVGLKIMNCVQDFDYTEISWKTGAVNGLHMTEYKTIFELVTCLCK